MILCYDTDAAVIHQRLGAGEPLVACLCTLRCHRCDDWWGDFDVLSRRFPEACFVWIDVDEHPDMVADIAGLSAYPFLLVRTDAVRLMQTVPLDVAVVQSLLHASLAVGAPPVGEVPAVEPGLHDYLLGYAKEQPQG